MMERLLITLMILKRQETLGRFTCSNLTTVRFQVQVWKGLLAKTMKMPIALFPKALMFHRLQSMMDLVGALHLMGLETDWPSELTRPRLRMARRKIVVPYFFLVLVITRFLMQPCRPRLEEDIPGAKILM